MQNIIMNDSTHVVYIEGKRNVDKLSETLIKPKRARTLKWTIDDAFFAHDKQMEVLRRLIADDPNLEERKFFIKEIKAKLDGYARHPPPPPLWCLRRQKQNSCCECI